MRRPCPVHCKLIKAETVRAARSEFSAARAAWVSVGGRTGIVLRLLAGERAAGE